MSNPTETEDPVRWSAGGGPPGSADFLAAIERASALPPALRTDVRGRLSRAVRPPAPRWITPTTVASAVVVGGVILWLLQPAAPPAPELALVSDAAVEAPLASAPPELGSSGPRPVAPSIEPAVVPEEPRPVSEASPIVATSGATGRLLVNSTPWSEVFLDGDALGPTPVMREVRPGRYTLRLESDEGVRDEIEIEIAAGESLRVVRDLHRPAAVAEPGPVAEDPASEALPGDPLEPGRGGRSGTLTVLSIPWARVFVDGEDTGHNTPLLRYRLPAGEHRLGLRTSDGVMHSETVTIEPGEESRVSRSLSLAAGDDPVAEAGETVADEEEDEPAGRGGGAIYDQATAAALTGNHREVIRLLDGHCRTQRDYELLIESLRAVPGMEAAVLRAMRAYVSRYPSTPRARAYQSYLMTHGG